MPHGPYAGSFTKKSLSNIVSIKSTTKPFVIIKPDAGTYGMGVMTVYDAE